MIPAIAHFSPEKGPGSIFRPMFQAVPLGVASSVYGFDLDAAQYFHLPYDTILLLNGEIGSVENWGGGSSTGGIVPIFDRLYLGGASTLRGFKFRDVGPKDNQGNALAEIL